MPSLWFCVPAHGRAQLAQICLRQLRRTCDALTADGIQATAVVIADDENLDTARELGFGTVERDNRFLSRKFNDGFQLACDPKFNPRPADYVVPMGSDDWIDHRILYQLPGPRTVVGFQRLSFVREDGREIRTAVAAYTGGCGMRIYPRQLLEPTGYRPADEDRTRACDTSILVNVTKTNGGHLDVRHLDVHDRQIVDWKNPVEQINSYDAVTRQWGRGEPVDPFEALTGIYPAEALAEMAAFYALHRDPVAA